MKTSRIYRQGGQAMVELVIVAGFVLVPLFLAIPLLGKYLDVRSAAVQSARYAAWERTVWYGGDAASKIGFTIPIPGFKTNSWIANEKKDGEIRNEIGVRYLSQTSDAFNNNDKKSTAYKGSAKTLWQDRNGTSMMLTNYNDALQNSVVSNKSPGTINDILSPVASLAATFGPFTLEMKGLYSATVSIPIKRFHDLGDAQNQQYLLSTTSTANFSESNVLLANGWNAEGPSAADKTSVKQQVKGLVPTTLLDFKIGDLEVMDLLQRIISVFIPEISKLDPGKIEPDVVPPDRLK